MIMITRARTQQSQQQQLQPAVAADLLATHEVTLVLRLTHFPLAPEPASVAWLSPAPGSWRVVAFGGLVVRVLADELVTVADAGRRQNKRLQQRVKIAIVTDPPPAFPSRPVGVVLVDDLASQVEPGQHVLGCGEPVLRPAFSVGRGALAAGKRASWWVVAHGIHPVLRYPSGDSGVRPPLHVRGRLEYPPDFLDGASRSRREGELGDDRDFAAARTFNDDDGNEEEEVEDELEDEDEDDVRVRVSEQDWNGTLLALDRVWDGVVPPGVFVKTRLLLLLSLLSGTSNLRDPRDDAQDNDDEDAGSVFSDSSASSTLSDQQVAHARDRMLSLLCWTTCPAVERMAAHAASLHPRATVVHTASCLEQLVPVQRGLVVVKAPASLTARHVAAIEALCAGPDGSVAWVFAAPTDKRWPSSNSNPSSASTSRKNGPVIPTPVLAPHEARLAVLADLAAVVAEGAGGAGAAAAAATTTAEERAASAILEHGARVPPPNREDTRRWLDKARSLPTGLGDRAARLLRDFHLCCCRTAAYRGSQLRLLTRAAVAHARLHGRLRANVTDAVVAIICSEESRAACAAASAAPARPSGTSAALEFHILPFDLFNAGGSIGQVWRAVRTFLYKNGEGKWGMATGH